MSPKYNSYRLFEFGVKDVKVENEEYKEHEEEEEKKRKKKDN